MMQPPLYGLCLPCAYVSARDGDTVCVRVLSGFVWAIRLIDCWAPDKGQPGYEEAKRFVQKVLRNANSLVLWVPAPENVEHLVAQGAKVNPLKLMTFDRVPGHIFLKSDVVRSDALLSEMLAHAGLAYATKAELVRSQLEIEKKDAV